jgi:5-methylcytosine-specific restriction endonuclease McrA
MGTSIPASSRAIVKARSLGRCERCGVPTTYGEAHHRRSRSVADEHRHCPCVLVWLCGTCHRWAHAHPLKARETGVIVSKFIINPYTVPMATPWGTRLHNCEGGITYL